MRSCSSRWLGEKLLCQACYGKRSSTGELAVHFKMRAHQRDPSPLLLDPPSAILALAHRACPTVAAILQRKRESQHGTLQKRRSGGTWPQWLWGLTSGGSLLLRSEDASELASQLEEHRLPSEPYEHLRLRRGWAAKGR